MTEATLKKNNYQTVKNNLRNSKHIHNPSLYTTLGRQNTHTHTHTKHHNHDQKYLKQNHGTETNRIGCNEAREVVSDIERGRGSSPDDLHGIRPISANPSQIQRDLTGFLPPPPLSDRTAIKIAKYYDRKREKVASLWFGFWFSEDEIGDDEEDECMFERRLCPSCLWKHAVVCGRF